MEIIERQGEGKFAISTAAIKKGNLVHVAHPLICVPNIGRIRAGTVCCGCLQRIQPSKQFSLSKSKSTNYDDDDSSSTSSPPSVCQSCKVATYCSDECRSQNSSAHSNSGECDAMTLFDSENNGNVQETDEETLVLACLISRALREGFKHFPVQNKKSETVVTAILGQEAKTTTTKQFSSLDAEVNFVRNQPRVSVGSLFPDFLVNKENKEEGDNKLMFAIPPPPTISSSSNSEKFPTFFQEDQKFRSEAIQKTFQNSNDENFNVSGAIPSFLSFCDLVSNAAAMNKAQLEYVEKLRMRYHSLAKKKFQNRKGNDNNKEDADDLLLFLHEKPIDPLFFVHFFSAYASNCFGAFDPKTDKKVSAGVYPDASYFNHSCSPNLVRRRQGRFECFYATKNIEKGECLNIDYNASDSDFRGVEERREHLLLHYRFWCICDRCNKEGPIFEEFKKRLEKEKKLLIELKEIDDQEQKSEQLKKRKEEIEMEIKKIKQEEASAKEIEEQEKQKFISQSQREQRHCQNCNIGGFMRVLWKSENEIGGFECRFCFDFVPF